jgi:hypothetical protein
VVRRTPNETYRELKPIINQQKYADYNDSHLLVVELVLFRSHVDWLAPVSTQLVPVALSLFEGLDHFEWGAIVLF